MATFCSLISPISAEVASTAYVSVLSLETRFLAPEAEASVNIFFPSYAV